jgi:hypothetical protein
MTELPMNTRGSMVVPGIAAVALLAHVSTAQGAGKITGLTLSPPPIETCVVETITVKGTGKCTSYTVFFGDGDKLLFLGKPKPFPQTFHHVYLKGGLTRVSAQAYTGRGSTCTGKASATVEVAAGPRPTITSDFTLGFFFSSDATPGAFILLQGENFGDMPGQVVLTDWKGMPQHFQLQNLTWGDAFAAGTVPAISGVGDQQGTITVVSQCGAVSNPWPAHFTAAPDFADLAYTTPMDSWGIYCSMSTRVTDHDACEGQGGSSFPPECAQNFPGWGMGFPLNNLAGYHDSGWGIPPFSHGLDGTDKYSLSGDLQNGWVLWSTSAEVTVQASAAGQSSGGQVNVDASLTSPPGTSSPTLGVDYHVNNCGAIFYQGHI